MLWGPVRKKIKKKLYGAKKGENMKGANALLGKQHPPYVKMSNVQHMPSQCPYFSGRVSASQLEGWVFDPLPLSESP